MRQLKGKTKESAKEKRQRKKEFAETHQQVFTLVLPVLGVLALCIAAYVYMKTRPKIFVD